MRHMLLPPLACLAAWLAAPSSASAQPGPDCAAIAAWGTSIDMNDRWQPSELSNRHKPPAALRAPAATALFGQPLTRMREADAAALQKEIDACAARTPRSREARPVQDGLRRANQAFNTQLIPYLRTRDQSLAAASAAMETLRERPPSLPLLQFYAALSTLAEGQAGLTRANQAASRLAGPESAAARSLMAAAREMEPEDRESALLRPAAASMDAVRTAVVETMRQEAANAPATAQGLFTLRQLRSQAVAESRQVLGTEGTAIVERAVAERQRTASAELADRALTDIAAMPDVPESWRRLEPMADSRLTTLLNEPDARRMQQAVAAKRAAIEAQTVAELQEALTALPLTDDGLQKLDGTLRPGLRALPFNSPVVTATGNAALDARRATIVEAVNKAEAGPLRGRVYADTKLGFKLEFVDRTRIFVTTPDGATAAGTYQEEPDGRVTVTLPGSSQVLTREGRSLIGGPMMRLRRVDPS